MSQEHSSNGGPTAPGSEIGRVRIGVREGNLLVALHTELAIAEGLLTSLRWSSSTLVTGIELPGAEVVARVDGPVSSEAVLRIDRALVHLSLGRGRATATLAAPDSSALGRARALLESSLPPPDTVERQEVVFNFWWSSDSSVRSMSRSLPVPTWEEIAGNYGAPAGSELERLMLHTEAPRSGQTVIWHGEPGTGKTSALRALAWEWQRWCDFHLVTDPEQLLGAQPGYLIELLSRVPDPEGKVHALVLEDSGEILGRDARALVGQGLSRFLNVCDGLLGQGLRLLLLVTTNEPLASLHPAVARPGRCLADVEFTHLTVAEANRWLGERCDHRVERATALADLYALAEDRPRPSRAGDRVVGFAAALPSCG